ncbi:3-deoxy-manno-octulosonate-8-phosphatase KdsC [Bowmanella denitrificans]|uniref:3-deoxy-D-manno-octulosonate 8-phosphate phosphatase KdsC n=1 Tax=Bowmanella denitrificans TaxID=366582 RepID=A0ABP3GTN1_9ALTE
MSHTQTPYGTLDTSIFKRFANIRLLACDVDGIFSDGRIYLGNDGAELKAFHTRDGYGVKALMKIGVEVAVITGRKSQIVEDRMRALGLRYIIQGQEDKQQALQDIAGQMKLNTEQIAAMGDDMPDLGMFRQAGIKISVPDGHPVVIQQADFITRCQGGFGAVREVCDMILQANHQLTQIHGISL